MIGEGFLELPEKRSEIFNKCLSLSQFKNVEVRQWLQSEFEDGNIGLFLPSSGGKLIPKLEVVRYAPPDANNSRPYIVAWAVGTPHGALANDGCENNVHAITRFSFTINFTKLFDSNGK